MKEGVFGVGLLARGCKHEPVQGLTVLDTSVVTSSRDEPPYLCRGSPDATSREAGVYTLFMRKQQTRCRLMTLIQWKLLHTQPNIQVWDRRGADLGNGLLNYEAP